jgi:crotonobetainyl-CoA:carnitine CoA-transferase CaiB-like acyl-CoA transferase
MAETPLSDLTIVDFTHARAGPWCTEILGELGAEVIKIERPGSGDSNRDTYPQQGGMGIDFIARYRNKKSVAVNLKDEQGRQLAEDLIADADVLVENFAPGVMDRLGLGYEYLIKEVNPQLVYASIKGYGETGPFKHKKGVDLVMQAEGGIMSVTGPEGGPPVKVGQAIGDIGAGLYSVIGILTALRQREATGRGQKFETDLFGTIVSFMEEYLTKYSITGENPTPNGTRHQTAVPYELFDTKDGRLAVYVPGSRWGMFVAEVLDDEELREYDSTQARQEHYEEIMSVMRPVLRERTTSEWIERFDELDIPCGPLNQVSDVIEHPQARERGYIIEYEDPEIGEVILRGFPLHFSEAETVFQSGPPQLGEYTDEVLAEHLGLSTEEIDQLRDESVVE